MLIEYFRRVYQYNLLIVAIEIFLIGLVVYWVVDFLEGTRGERLFRSVIFILIAGFLILNLLVRRYDFVRLQYLYNGFLIFVLILAVAAFQPEIRRALLRIGQLRFRTSVASRLTGVIDQIVSAVFDLSEKKTGAIIVLERRIALGEFIENGIPMDSLVTAELLKTIFTPPAPLHDMAVVIRDERIVAASVELPMAEAGSVGGVELGSRHRAAIGISAGSDAICIVVSEETGIVSVAKGGNLTRNLSPEQLRTYLADQLGQNVPAPGRFHLRNAKVTDTGKQV
jgi:diadenylate cyclase